ncbi:olfactory receptor 10A3-like [Odontesthes bonariensis]|uniref:olfactory receptor 10A3-like n=1 Tax=Odontesthes bonariensis TaxID=219752 RepID=UPI003F58CF0C
MENNSSLNSYYFQLTLFTDFGLLRYLFFGLCLLIYVTIICFNVVIILTVCLEKSLHQPMYVFICCLSFNSLSGSAGLFPRLLMDILSDTHLISRPSCFTQMFVIYVYAACEMTILCIMAYDRFVAICQPLHYHSKMTFKMVMCLIIFAELYPVILCGYCLSIIVSLPLCGNKLNRLFCTSWPVIQLSCVDTSVNNIASWVAATTTVFVPLFFVLYTYLRILHICRKSSSEFRGKSLRTCLPHLVTFVNFSLSVFCELSLSRLEADKIDAVFIVFLSLEFLIIPPIINPLVYGLNLPQIKTGIFTRLTVRKRTPSK